MLIPKALLKKGFQKYFYGRRSMKFEFDNFKNLEFFLQKQFSKSVDTFNEIILMFETSAVPKCRLGRNMGHVGEI